MIKVCEIKKAVNAVDYERTLFLKKGEMEIELSHEDLKEIDAVLNGKRKVLTTSPNEGDYHSPIICLHNHDRSK
jgi:hypothetical protein